MCLENCPCGTWVNCRYYNKNLWRDIHPEIFDVELHNWYDSFFRIVFEHGNSLGNG